MKKKLVLNEELFLEGKNLDKTFDQYKDKLPYVEEEDNRDYFNKVMSWDPTYQEGGTTTGDFGIWILNQIVKRNIQEGDGYFEAEPEYGQWNFVGDLLNDFIEKKSNLEKKDINQYKTPTELYQVLKNVELSDRQKERKIRKDVKGAKKIGSTANFDIYIPETYEASCALGKGSGWCTADSRTRQYYDYYKDQYGGDYYIAISKDGKYKYQLHFESQQYSAAGTNPNINRPNDEKMLSLSELNEEQPELVEFFREQIISQDPEVVLRQILEELDIEDISIYYPPEQIAELDRGRYSNKLMQWYTTDPDTIPSIRVFQALTSNADAFGTYNKILEKRDKNHLLTIDTLQDLVYEAFKIKFTKRLVNLKTIQNADFRCLKFPIMRTNTLRFECTQYQLIHKLIDNYGFEINSAIQDRDFDGLKESISVLLPEDEENFNASILRLFKSVIIWDLRKLQSVPIAYFNSVATSTFFFEEFEDLVMDAVMEAELARSSEGEE